MKVSRDRPVSETGSACSPLLSREAYLRIKAAKERRRKKEEKRKKEKKERKKPRGTTFIAFACGAFVLQPLSCLHGHYLVEGLGTEISFAVMWFFTDEPTGGRQTDRHGQRKP